MSRQTKISVAVALGIIVVSCGLCGRLIFQSIRELPRLQSSAELFMAELEAGRVDSAYKSASIPFRDSMRLEPFRAKVATFPALTTPGTRTMIGSRINNGTRGIVQFSVVSPPNSAVVTLSLILDYGDWKVDGFSIP